MPLIYHFTDIENVPLILAAGCLRSHRAAACAVDVADVSIKSRRTTKQVPCGPGGTVGDYVPFYFAPRSPMLYRIQQGGVEDVSPDPARLVYVVSRTEAIVEAELKYVFSDGNAAAVFTKFDDDIAHLDEAIDWPLMKATMWANTPDDPDRRRRRGAEFLIHDQLPLELVLGFAVYDEAASSVVTTAAEDGGWELPVHVRTGWYF